MKLIAILHPFIALPVTIIKELDFTNAQKIATSHHLAA